MSNRRVAGNLSVGSVACDFIVVLSTAIPLLIFHEWVTPYKRGFYCDDESIRYPYRPSTVSRQMLIVIGILIPTLLIMGTELLRTMVWERKYQEEFGAYRYKKYTVHRLIVRLYVFIGYFLLGICFNQLMVDIAKYTIGRHRPHFMDVCKPTSNALTYSANGVTQLVTKDYRSNCPADEHIYVTDFECKGDNKYLIHESMLSFYSGHAAFSFYAAWYTTLYLQARVYRPLVSKLVLPAIQFSLFGGAAFVAYTRVSNYKHHWSDVLVGALVGSAIGIINAYFIAEVFQRRELPTHYRQKRRLLGLYTLSPDENQQETVVDDLGRQLETVRVANDDQRREHEEAVSSTTGSGGPMMTSVEPHSQREIRWQQPRQVHVVPIRRLDESQQRRDGPTKIVSKF